MTSRRIGLDHTNIVKLYDWFESKTKFFLVFEIASGGELFNRICEQGKLTEADAVQTMKATLVRSNVPAADSFC